MIIEDDIEFEVSFLDKLSAIWIEDFDMLFLNGTDGVQNKPVEFNASWVRINELYGAFGYIVNSRFYGTLLRWLKTNDCPTDKVYSMLMPLYKVYKCKVPLIFHRPGMSDIQGIVPKNYKHLEKRATKNRFSVAK